MRIVGEIPHPIYKISILKIEDRLQLKFENGKNEFTLKFRSEEVTVEDLLNKYKPTKEIDDIFMNIHTFKTLLVHELHQNNLDEFDTII